MPLGMVDSFAATLHAALHGGPADNGAEANGHRSKFESRRAQSLPGTRLARMPRRGSRRSMPICGMRHSFRHDVAGPSARGLASPTSSPLRLPSAPHSFDFPPSASVVLRPHLHGSSPSSL